MPTPLVLPPALLILCSLIPVSALAVTLFRVWREILSDEERLYSALLFVLSIIALWPSVYHASNVLISDAVEYGIGAYRMFTRGSYDIPLNGQSFPPRYPIGFSLFVLMPGFWIAGEPSIGAGIFGVFLLTALGTPCAYLAGVRLHSAMAGFLAAAAYLASPGLWIASQEVVTNAPAASLWLVPLALLAVNGDRERMTRSSCLGIGMAIMLATACRPLSGLIIAPLAVWLVAAREGKMAVLYAMVPVSLLVALYLVYNALVFGSPFRSGYNFWCAIPYDFSSMVFSVRHISENLASLWDSRWPIFLLLALPGVGVMRVNKCSRGMLLVAFASALLLTSTHLTYFYQFDLFFLPASAVFAPFVGVSIAAFVAARGIRLSVAQGLVIPVLVLVIVGLKVQRHSHRNNQQIDYIEAVGVSIPDGSVFVSGLNPALLQVTLGDSKGVTVIPSSRKVEFANKVMVPERLREIPAINPTVTDYSSIPLPPGSFIKPFEEVVSENPELISRSLLSGRQVYLDTRHVAPELVSKLGEQFLIEKVWYGLARLETKTRREQ